MPQGLDSLKVLSLTLASYRPARLSEGGGGGSTQGQREAQPPKPNNQREKG